MTKLSMTIEIDDVNDPYQCAEAIRSVFRRLHEYHSDDALMHIFVTHVLARWTTDEWVARQKFERACSIYPRDELRLVLEYCAMDKPSKLGLAKLLAQRNRTLPPAERYCRGSTSETTMLQQIKRVFKKGSIDEIAAGAPELRAEELRHCEYYARKKAPEESVTKRRRRKW